MSWKNGAGVTQEVLSEPADAGVGDFGWRLSLAELTRSGPFSTFPGVDRTIVLLEGTSVTVTIGGVAQALRRWEPLQFSGDCPASARVAEGPTRDLNVMTRRSRFTARTQVNRVEGHTPLRIHRREVVVLVVLAGPLTVRGTNDDENELAYLDSCRVSGEGSVDVRGTGTLALVRLQDTDVSASPTGNPLD